MLLRRRPDVADRLADVGLEATLAHAAEASRDADVGRGLRIERQAVALAVALADLAGAPLETVTQALSAFADRALDRAIAAAFAERVGAEPVAGFTALALGKQGSRELNYSSDIDPILLFDPETMPRRPREDPAEAAVRIARRVVTLLQEPTADGYVVRVDLRLRPASEATPLAVPIDAAISYYESSALPWERAAFIRARAVAGDVALGERFLAQLRPFVWRRALDYGAVREIRAMSYRIRDHHRQGQILGPGYDLKRGRGGIREVEFFTQIHQLIHGGRDVALRAPATLAALAALADAGHIAPEEAATLADAYRVLRTVEHRLQMVDDRQTHRLPEQPTALDSVARLEGLADGDALIAMLAPCAGGVGSIYDQLQQDGGTALPHAPDLLEQILAEAGFDEPHSARARIDGWRTGKARSMRSNAAQEALEQVLPALIAALGRAPAPQTALNRFDDLVSRLPTAINLFRLLEARPGLLALLADILANAPVLADALARRAQLLDGLIDASALDLPPEVATLTAELGEGERGDGYEAVLERARTRVGERRFALGVQLVAGRADPIAIGEGYGRVAEAAIETLASAAVAAFEEAHGRVPGGELAILALGRLGGGVLTHASDLDIVFLFTGDFRGESDGRRPLGVTTYFNRLAQRVIAALSVPTAAGPLYPVDTRLRPFGGDGLLAVSIDSFARYQEEGAWTWEHMALTRARPVFGSADARARVQAAVDATLIRPNDDAAMTADAARMRSEIARHKPPAGPFDVKLIAGGLVDAEFAVQLSQLRHHIGLYPAFDRAARTLEEADLLAPGFADAAALLTRLLITLRLIAPESDEPAERSRAVVARACGATDWDALLDAYAAARALIAEEWRRVAGLV
jgi:glutamate-ammonia-ligase adenylyltransferase